MRKIVFILIVVALMAGLSVPVQAGVKSLTLKVDGLACPFCAYGMEKKLKKVEGVEKLEIDLDGGTVTLKMKARVRLTAASEGKEKAPAGLVAQVQKAVTEGGFTLRELTVTVEGQVVAQEGVLRLRLSGTEEILVLKENGKVADLKKAVSNGSVTLIGTLQTEDPMLTLSVEQVSEMSVMEGEVHRLKVSGMVCTGCADAIKAALERISWVQQQRSIWSRGWPRLRPRQAGSLQSSSSRPSTGLR